MVIAFSIIVVLHQLRRIVTPNSNRNASCFNTRMDVANIIHKKNYVSQFLAREQLETAAWDDLA